jgi:SNF family Na+-dependent transporter
MWKLRSLKESTHGVIDITVAITVGIVFAALMVIAYIIWTLKVQLVTKSSSAAQNNSIANITTGFDQTIKIIIIAILVAVLAIALSYLMMLRHE